MKACLLDINVLLALAWPNHPHHAAAHQWFERHADDAWATCLVTQLGFIRISSNPAFSTASVSPTAAHDLLSQWITMERHKFWPGQPNGLQSSGFRELLPDILTHKYLTDAYLVSLTRFHGGKLATFDRPLHRMFPDTIEQIGGKE